MQLQVLPRIWKRDEYVRGTAPTKTPLQSRLSERDFQDGVKMAEFAFRPFILDSWFIGFFVVT